MSWRNYLSIARVDHWFKNIFMLPGTVVALFLTKTPVMEIIFPLGVGVLSTCLIASANYVINEWLDADSDRFHPVKKNRPAVQANLSARWVYTEYVLLLAAGVALAAAVSIPFLWVVLSLAVMGLIYNVRPFRTKERLYLDVLSESINNPIRLILGWFVVSSELFPPSSLLFGYWMGGAFLMGMKRFAEYRFIGDVTQAGLYRRSFRYYTEEKLLISSFFYALCAAFFLGVFLIKYRIEFIVLLPFLAFLFTWYARLGFRDNSPVQHPERLFRETALVIYVLFIAVFFVFLAGVELPWLYGLVLP